MATVSDIRRYVETQKQKIRTVATEAPAELSKRIILDTPVLRGTTRANWHTTINTPSNTSIPWTRDSEGVRAPASSPSSNFAISNNREVLNRAFGELIYFVNTVEYARGLEFGTGSTQAPQGMLGINVLHFGNITQQVIASLR